MSEPVDLDAIEARANAATPGPWHSAADPSGPEWTDFATTHLTDAEHIAGMDPATTLALVAEVRALRAKVEAVEEIVEDGPWYSIDFHGEVQTVAVDDLRRALGINIEGGDDD